MYGIYEFTDLAERVLRPMLIAKQLEASRQKALLESHQAATMASLAKAPTLSPHMKSIAPKISTTTATKEGNGKPIRLRYIVCTTL